MCARSVAFSLPVVLAGGPPGTLRADFVAGGADGWTTWNAGSTKKAIFMTEAGKPRMKMANRVEKSLVFCQGFLVALAAEGLVGVFFAQDYQLLRI